MMDSSMYKEISYKIQGFRIVSWLIAAVSLLLTLLIGIGCYILVIGMHGKEAFPDPPVLDERITIVEGNIPEQPLAEKSIQHIDFNDGIPTKVHEEGVEPIAHLQHANKFLRNIEEPRKPVQTETEIHPNNYKTSFSMRYPVLPDSQIQSQAEDNSESLQETLQMLDSFAAQLIDGADDDEEAFHHRAKRAIGAGLLAYAPYLSYGFFSKFMYNKVSKIAEYNLESRSFESRKLGGDPVADFLDGFWQQSAASEPSKPSKTVKKSSAEHPTEVQAEQPKKPWSPMVNQVPITFVAEILRTLLNLMKEFLMKDHVMECLWYMFCGDVNETAKSNDIYGILSRINSVGLKVLTESDQQLREIDTFNEIWRSVTSWQPLQCDVLFPRCDGPRALEIVNEVAMGTNISS